MAFRSFAFLLAFISAVGAFAPNHHSSPARNPTTSLQANKVATSFLAGVYLFANVATLVPPAAVAIDTDDYFGSSQVIAKGGRSGGRAGGRSASAPTRAASPSKTVYKQSTTYVQPAPTVVVSPGYGYGYGYNPMGGLGLGLGINAIGSIGEGIREYRQESEIADSRRELNNARVKEAELEARLRQLEAAQQQQK